MEELVERPGLFTRIVDRFAPRHADEGYDDYDVPTSHGLRVHAVHRYHVTVRRQVVSFQDAIAAADGLKRGEQQILNLSMASPELREKIKDFMCGVNYNADGTWEELGEGVFLLAPATASVEVATATSRMQVDRN